MGKNMTEEGKRRIKWKRKQDKVFLTIFLVRVGLLLFVIGCIALSFWFTYVIAESDLPLWIKFILLTD